jgi:hypothetical protein
VRGVRGDARRALIDRLSVLDAELLRLAHDTLGQELRAACEQEADDELDVFRARLSAEAYQRARAAAIDRIVRERLRLPTLSFV